MCVLEIQEEYGNNTKKEAQKLEKNKNDGIVKARKVYPKFIK